MLETSLRSLVIPACLHAYEWDSKEPVIGACQLGTLLQGNLVVPLIGKNANVNFKNLFS